MEPLTFELRPVPPFRLDLTVWALRRRARNIVDRWDGVTYRRVLVIGCAPVEVAVTQVGSSDHPRLAVAVNGHSTAESRTAVSDRLSRMLGLRVHLDGFYALAARDKRLAPLAERFRGLKPPRFPSVFEALVNAIACQQLSLTVGIELLNRLAAQCGRTLASGGSLQYSFPRPQDVLRVSAQTLRYLGFSYGKARSLLELSRSRISGAFDPEQLENLDSAGAIAMLMKVRGVGRWTAEYVLLRGLGRTSVFPGDDVGARNRLALWLGRDAPFSYDGVKRVVGRWQPYAGLVYFHLLLAGLSESREMHPSAAAQMSA